MRMYEVMILPLAEEDIINNTDYIAFEKKAPETENVPILSQYPKKLKQTQISPIE